jgi:hypothetical protein
MSTVKTTIGVYTWSQTGAKAQTTVAKNDIVPEPETASPRHRYSDVVAHRLPTPVQGEGAEQLDRDPDCKVPGAFEETPLFTSDEETEQVRAHVVYCPQDEEGPWTSVQC